MFIVSKQLKRCTIFFLVNIEFVHIFQIYVKLKAGLSYSCQIFSQIVHLFKNVNWR